MRPSVILLLAALALSACASSHALPMPEGEFHALNVGKWDFNANDLRSPPPRNAGSAPNQVAVR